MSGIKTPTFYVGYKYLNKQGLDVEVVEYRGRKDITVEFKMDGARKVTTGTYIKKGLPMHPTLDKPFIGQQFPCHDGDVIEIVEIESTSKIKVKWLSDGTETYRTLPALKEGHNRHPTKNVPKVGQVFKTNNHGDVVVKEFKNATNVRVAFDDGTEVITTVSSLGLGNVAHPTRKIRLGKEYVTNSGWKGVAIEYKDAHNVLVRWQDGSESWHSASNLLCGSVKPPMQPSVEGIGYFGIGRFVPNSYAKGEVAPEKIYGYWVRMFSRCYNEFELQKSTGRSYADKYVHEHWHNFQNFAEWALSQPNWDEEGFELDKDLLVKGNDVYSESTCCFLPAEINVFLVDKRSGKYPKGVHEITPKTPNETVGYIARCNVDGERKYLGFYPTPEQAFEAYKQCKEAHAKVLAERWKHKLTDVAYNALYDFKAEMS